MIVVLLRGIWYYLYCFGGIKNGS